MKAESGFREKAEPVSLQHSVRAAANIKADTEI